MFNNYTKPQYNFLYETFFVELIYFCCLHWFSFLLITKNVQLHWNDREILKIVTRYLRSKMQKSGLWAEGRFDVVFINNTPKAGLTWAVLQAFYGYGRNFHFEPILFQVSFKGHIWFNSLEHTFKIKMVLLDQLFVTKFLSKSQASKSFEIHIRGCKWLIFYSNTSSDMNY